MNEQRIGEIIKEMLELALAVDGLHTYIEDFNKLSGGRMCEKYGDNPMDGTGNIARRSKAVYQRAEVILENYEQKKVGTL